MGSRRTSPPPSNPYVEIGHRIAELRKARGIRQVELAEQLGVSQGNVSDYETGKTKIACDQIIELTKILEISADELLGLEPSPKVTGVKDHRVIQRMIQIDQLPKRKKDALLMTIKAFLSSS